jgi:D-serine deaminase-like pyridoxal phosphate-dependent protein
MLILPLGGPPAVTLPRVYTHPFFELPRGPAMRTPDSMNTARLARLDLADYTLPPDVADRLASPALVIYEDKVVRNVEQMIAYADGNPHRWQPHLKTTKTPEVYALLVDAGIRHFKCATVREAKCLLEVLHAASVTGAELLISYPLQGPALPEAGRLGEQFPDVSIAVISEDPGHAARVPAGLGVFVDVNSGMNRTGIPVADGERIEAVARAAGDRFRGVHAYDGHIHGSDAASRRAEAHGVYDQVVARIKALLDAGFSVATLITSGTPGFRYALDYPGFSGGDAGGQVGDTGCVHRISPGTVVFHDLEYDSLLEDVELVPAAVVFSRVVSHPRDGMATCDAGSKSIAAERGDPVAFVLGHTELALQSPSEEHLPMMLTDGAPAPALGEALYLVPRHVCPTVNLAEQALFVRRDGSVEAVSVAARAHPLLF